MKKGCILDKNRDKKAQLFAKQVVRIWRMVRGALTAGEADAIGKPGALYVLEK